MSIPKSPNGFTSPVSLGAFGPIHHLPFWLIINIIPTLRSYLSFRKTIFSKSDDIFLYLFLSHCYIQETWKTDFRATYNMDKFLREKERCSDLFLGELLEEIKEEPFQPNAKVVSRMMLTAKDKTTGEVRVVRDKRDGKIVTVPGDALKKSLKNTLTTSDEY